MYLDRGMFFSKSGVTRDCLKCMGKVSVDRERVTMVVIIGRIVAEIVVENQEIQSPLLYTKSSYGKYKCLSFKGC